MSTHYELVFVIRDGIIPSNIVSLCEEAMRRKMFSFIQHEHEVLDMKTFAKPALIYGNLERYKEMLNGVASDMDLREDAMRSRMYLCNMCAGKSMHIDLSMVSNCENIDELTSQMALLSSNEENQHVPDESCEIRERLNVSNTSNSESGECSFNSQAEILDQTQNENAIYRLYLLFTDEMCIELNRRLIKETECCFATIHRNAIEVLRKDVRERLRVFRKTIDCNRAPNWKAEHACSREKFLARAGLQAPKVLRVIDIEATCRQGERVVLIDYNWVVKQVGYTAISHTYGMDVYEVFDCPCASECSASVHPRCPNKARPHQDDASSPDVRAACSEKHKRIVNDILRMCDILRKAGVNYAWHDGVCIAQHDAAEVAETIKHMGWIYENAKETIIFLHYVGNPMAPIRNSNVIDELCCRWQTRVWTLQEGALSKCRRYCVRVGLLGDCQSLKEFEEKIDLWYGDDSSTIEIMEEERFFEFVKEIYRVLWPLIVKHEEKVLSIPDDADDDVIVESNWMRIKATKWSGCIAELIQNLLWTCFEFPRMETTLYLCSLRDSKHRGDKMNSILALLGVEGFVAEKDVNVEASTIDFFKRQGQVGLATALLSINRDLDMKDKQYITEEHKHTWPPMLWSGLKVYQTKRGLDKGIGFEVLKDGRMELRGDMMACLKVRFTVRPRLHMRHGDTDDDDDHEVVNAAGEDIRGDDEQLMVLPNDLACLEVDLTRFGIEFKASIAEHIMGDVSISAIEKCNSASQGRVLSCEIRDGDSFDAYLVLAELSCSLIVQGPTLDAPVSKVGVFEPHRIEFLLYSLPIFCPALALIQKLIII